LVPNGAEAAPSHVASPARRVRPNAATASAAALDAAVAARDEAAIVAQVSDDAEVVDHPTGIAYGRDGILASARMLLAGRNATHRLEPLATLGYALGLFRRTMTASDFDTGDLASGAMTIETVAVIGVDAAGRRRRAELFAPDRRRRRCSPYALPRRDDRHGRTRAASHGRWPPRPAARPSGTRSSPRPTSHPRSVPGSLPDAASSRSCAARHRSRCPRRWRNRVDDVMALRPDGILMRWRTSASSAGGGA
jgi:hypothetical protein